jgi:hypothetical protein
MLIDVTTHYLEITQVAVEVQGEVGCKYNAPHGLRNCSSDRLVEQIALAQSCRFSVTILPSQL